MSEDPSDGDLARLARDGDRAAFRLLVERHQPAVRARARRLCANPSDVEDVMQESFLRLVRNRQKLRVIENVAAYLFVMVRHEALRFASRKAKVENFRLIASDLFLEAGGNDASRRELADLVAQALQTLSPMEREVVELKIYAGLTFREIAQITDVPLQTAATRYRSALVRLKPFLAGQMT